MSREAWLSALGETDQVDDQEALTAKEIGVLLGTSQQAAYHRAERLVSQGKAVRTQKRLSGQRWGGKRYAMAYRLLDGALARRGK